VAAVWRAPLSGRERALCYLELGRWLTSRLRPGGAARPLEDSLETTS